MIPDISFWPALAVAGLGAFLDIKNRRLPNWLCAVLALAAAGGLVMAEGFTPLPWALLHAVIALIAGMILFRFGVFGGGDAKFYAAAACAIPLSEGLYLLGWTSAAGLVLLIAMAVGRRFLASARGTPIFRGWAVPYGVAIAAGFGLTMFLS